MGPMRKCCGYYCALTALVGIFFYGVMIVMEIRRNEFVLWKLQYPEPEAVPDIYKTMTAPEVRAEMVTEADNKVTALAIAIGLNVLCILGCLLQVKVGEKQERARASQEEAHAEEFKEN